MLDWLINLILRRAMRTPYYDLPGYMERWWLFNSWERPGYKQWLPTIRIHHILRADADRHLHNHPWNAWTVILRGWYLEEREDGLHGRWRLNIARIRASDFHRIVAVSEDGVWTMFISTQWRQVWGFKTENGFVPWREYLKKE